MDDVTKDAIVAEGVLALAQADELVGVFLSLAEVAGWFDGLGGLSWIWGLL